MFDESTIALETAEPPDPTQTVESLQASLERFRTVADFTYDWEYWVTLDGNLDYVSPSCQRITGYRRMNFSDIRTCYRRSRTPTIARSWPST